MKQIIFARIITEGTLQFFFTETKTISFKFEVCPCPLTALKISRRGRMCTYLFFKILLNILCMWNILKNTL